MSCPRRRQCGGGTSWSYSWSSCGGVTTYKTSGNVPAQYLQQLQGGGSQQCGKTQTVTSSQGGSQRPEGHAEASKDYYEFGLYLHNWYRKRHGSPKLVLDDRLNKAADAYAYQLARRGCLQHTSGLDYNENLYMSSDTSLSKKDHVRAACKAWYDEIKYYNWNNPGFSMQTGHFTAMVFKTGKQLGIGVGVAGSWVVVVANYKPHANMQGTFRANVLPYRDVEDSDDEEEKTKKEEAKSEEAKKEAEAEKKAESSSSSSDDDSSEDEDEVQVRKAFDGNCDETSTIGWAELRELLDGTFQVQWSFGGFDMTICKLLISMMTLRDGEKKRIGFDDFKKILDSVVGFMDAYAEFDKDNSGLLDPFELKMALQEAGFEISFKTYQTLQTIFAEGDSGELDFRGFVLCFILLSKLQIVQQKRTGFEDFSMKDWMQNELKLASKE